MHTAPLDTALIIAPATGAARAFLRRGSPERARARGWLNVLILQSTRHTLAPHSAEFSHDGHYTKRMVTGRCGRRRQRCDRNGSFEHRGSRPGQDAGCAETRISQSPCGQDRNAVQGSGPVGERHAMHRRRDLAFSRCLTDHCVDSRRRCVEVRRSGSRGRSCVLPLLCIWFPDMRGKAWRQFNQLAVPLHPYLLAGPCEYMFVVLHRSALLTTKRCGAGPLARRPCTATPRLRLAKVGARTATLGLKITVRRVSDALSRDTPATAERARAARPSPARTHPRTDAPR